MAAFNIWKENPPPRNTDVLAKYELTKGEWQLVRTCNHGCCVSRHGYTMVLPKYWREVAHGR